MPCDIPLELKSACEKRMQIPSFTDAYFCTTHLPAILLQLFFYQVRRLQAQLFSAVCHWLYLPLLQSQSCSRSSTFTPVWYPSLCTTLFYVTALSMAYPLMQDVLSAMKSRSVRTSNSALCSHGHRCYLSRSVPRHRHSHRQYRLLPSKPQFPRLPGVLTYEHGYQ